MKSVIHPEAPQRYHVEVAVFDVVFYNETVGRVFDLALGFALAAYLEGLVVYQKI